MRWIVSPLLIVIGMLMMKYTTGITSITGKLGFAEKYFQTMGGTYFWWRILGLGACILGLLWLTGVIHVSGNSSLQITGS